MPDWILPLVALLLACGALALAWDQRRRARDERRSVEELRQRLQLQQQSISGLTAGALGVDRRLRTLESGERRLAERQDIMENTRRADQPYSEAIRLVQQGATATRLVEELDISESEADLIVRLHGARVSA